MANAPLIQASPEEMQVLLEVGQIYYLRGEYENAEKVFRGALVLSPGNGDLFAAAGAACHVQKKHDEALAFYEKALDACPAESCAKSNRAELMLLAGNKEEAIAELKATIEQAGLGNTLGDRAQALLKIAEGSAEA